MKRSFTETSQRMRSIRAFTIVLCLLVYPGVVRLCEDSAKNHADLVPWGCVPLVGRIPRAWQPVLFCSFACSRGHCSPLP